MSLPDKSIYLSQHEIDRLEIEFNKLWYSMRRYYVDEFFLRRIKSIGRNTLILDLGGHKHQKRGVFDINAYQLNVYYANLNANKGADFLSDAAAIATVDSCFSTVICAELLEHVPDPRSVLTEVYRVLVPSGKLLITVPFLYPIHADPYDFGRYTDFYWLKTLEEIGFSHIEIEKQGLFWSVMVDMMRVYVYEKLKPPYSSWKLLRRIYISTVLRAKRFARAHDAKYSNQADSFTANFTTGFGIYCIK
jgi:ubiquinone/menaquinone biosynthesis C-methylase UbiE